MRWRGKLEKIWHPIEKDDCFQVYSLDDDDEQENDKELSLIVKIVRRMCNKAKFNNKRQW